MLKTSYNANSTGSFMSAMGVMAEAMKELKIDSESSNLEFDKENNFDRLKILSQIIGELDQISEISTDYTDSDSEVDLHTFETNQQLDDTNNSVVFEIKEKLESDIYKNVIQLLKNDVSDEELQSTLFDLLGFDNFDLISSIVQHKKKILADAKDQEFRLQKLNENVKNGSKVELLPKEYSVVKTYPHVYQATSSQDAFVFGGQKFLLPLGTTRVSHAKYEELVIPVNEGPKPSYVTSGDLVNIADLDVLCQKTFANYKTLNRVQSRVFPVAYKTNENMLICAPTGAGKTDIAMLTILHTISQFVTKSSNNIDVEYSEFKIVYIAPLKALAAEIVEKFTKKLRWLNIQVRELTGDMQLSRSEILATQVIVTTPEKWDVVTRKATDDNELVSKLRLLIIDEVHLLHEERGSVIETLVARTLRQVESSQSMIRVVGLSATLPNYVDVADFLGVSRFSGMFYFDQNFRPVPLRQELCGIRQKPNTREYRADLDNLCYDKLIKNLEDGDQVMIFVHSRKSTVATAQTLINLAGKSDDQYLFDCSDCEKYEHYKKEVGLKSRGKELAQLFFGGFGVHHAGMLRKDRNLVEQMFADGCIKVLVCTATLAWGVNLPASTVIIKGTEVYDPKKGGFVDLGISDVIQIFGRAGRPQYERYGTSILLTTAGRLEHYISLLTQQHPIESKLASKLADNLNAEISLGTVQNVDEAVRWLGYTYLFTRMKKNPFGYGLDWKKIQTDPQLIGYRRDMIIKAARRLHFLQMIVFDERSEAFISKDLGRIASEFYLLNDSIEVFNKTMNPMATEADVLAMISVSSEFDHIASRPDEATELKSILDSETRCQVASDDVSESQTKTNVLLQAYISKASLKNSALISDCNYVAQNAARICRALFFVGLNRRWAQFSKIMLSICKSIDKQQWHFDYPLSQFDIQAPILRQLQSKNVPIDTLKDMSSDEIGDLIHNKGMGGKLYQIVAKFPLLFLETQIFPLTSTVMRVRVSIETDFKWDRFIHGSVEPFWIFVESSNNDSKLLHYERFVLDRKNFNKSHDLEFLIPLESPLPSQLIVSAVSDKWIGSNSMVTVSLKNLVRPINESFSTRLLKLQPLPVSALHDKEIEKIYTKAFHYFNAMQTMVFHTLYHTNSSVFLGSPTGSGKTVAAELAIWHAFKEFPGSKVVYIAPMKALVRERVDDWRNKICKNTDYKLVELTGDSMPESKDVQKASIIVTTPEKFDGISRNWHTRKFVQQVSLIIMDEIHLLASDRGPVLEMIVSRMKYVAKARDKQIRLLGMSTAVSNPHDMASWLGIEKNSAVFNFPQAVRPVPLQMYIDGFPDNLAFCPLMKKMNKPAFHAIKQHSPNKPVLIFVASRRQTRLTALDIIHMCGLEDNPKRFLHMDEDEVAQHVARVKDDTLKLAIQFGIGLHHAGLVESDRKVSHELFASNKIQVLVATSTLAWGVNLPAHLVIIKGTQFFDAKIEGYRDMDLTDVLQMMGRAGRPAFDTQGIAMVYTREGKKNFYKHFLNVGFPVESSLHKVLDDHLGAEIASGTVTSQQEAVDFLTWTFLFRRIHNNPTYYDVKDEFGGASEWLTNLVDDSLISLKNSKCLKVTKKANGIKVLQPTPLLKIASFYYLSHKTIRMFMKWIKPDLSFEECLSVLSLATEYNELPTRHGEELINAELSSQMRYSIDSDKFEGLPIWDPHVKTFLLLQAYFTRIEMPIQDYIQDTVTVLDQALRILQAYIDICADFGYLKSLLSLIKLVQCVKQGIWFDDDPIKLLPGSVSQTSAKGKPTVTLKDLGLMNELKLRGMFRHNKDIEKFVKVARSLPTGSISIKRHDKSKLQVRLIHNNFVPHRVYCSKYPKPQNEGWYFILCYRQKNSVIVFSRVSISGGKNQKGSASAIFDVPSKYAGEKIDILCVNDAMDIEYADTTLID